MSSGAISILSELARRDGSRYVLPRDNDLARHLSKEVMETAWRRVRHHAGNEDLRLHGLRHTVGTFASQAGGNAFLIGHLPQHSNVTVTNRYVNPDADPIREITETIGNRIEAGLRSEIAEE